MISVQVWFRSGVLFGHNANQFGSGASKRFVRDAEFANLYVGACCVLRVARLFVACCLAVDARCLVVCC